MVEPLHDDLIGRIRQRPATLPHAPMRRPRRGGQTVTVANLSVGGLVSKL